VPWNDDYGTEIAVLSSSFLCLGPLESHTMILAGDIGGTKTVIAHYEESGGRLRQLRVATFKIREHRSLEDILAGYVHLANGDA
jgi:glucokinase